MKRGLVLAAIALVSVFISSSAEARRHKKHVRPAPVAQVEPCFFICPQQEVTRAGRTIKRSKRYQVVEHTRVSGIVAPLAAKAAEISAACGSRVISGVRHTYIAGTRRISLHASGQAADMQGNPRCIYAHLQGWPGGYSTDYGRVNHVHISYTGGGREWGIRFAHGGHKKKHRHARHRHKHYAVAR